MSGGRGGGVVDAVRFAGTFGRELVRLGADRLGRGQAVPGRPIDLTAPQVGALIGRSVTSVEVLGETSGTTDRVRLALTGTDVPDSVFVKMAAAKPAIRLFGNLADLGHDEVRFYRDVRPGLEIEAPHVFGAAYDPRTKRFALVLEDLEARGCQFPDVLAHLDRPQVEAVLTLLAQLHGALWETPRLATGARGGDLRWVRSNGSDPLLPAIAFALRRAQKQLAKTDPGLSSPDGSTIVADYLSIARQLDLGPQTVLHGDPHPGNCYFDGPRAGLLDWQAIRRGNPLRDVAYFLVLALEPEQRRELERGLVDHYADALAAAGGPALGADRWTTYRKMAAVPYISATFTAGFGGLQMQAITHEALRRAGLAIAELETVDALRA